MAERHLRTGFGSGFFQAGYLRRYFDNFASELGMIGYTHLTFTVVIDDFDMGITHVVRGDDHLNNTPRQL